jgi:hypothetical protein
VSTTEHTAPGHDPGEDADDDLTTVVRELSDRIETLQADVRRLGGPGLPGSDPGWSSEDAAPAEATSYAWVNSIESPLRRRRTVPRLPLEVLFLVGVATAAGVAELDAPVIAGVMAASWLLVALIEWAASRADRSRDAYAYPRIEPLTPAEPLPADPSWFVPPVEHTLVEQADSPTAVTRLPPPLQDVDATVERAPDPPSY